MFKEAEEAAMKVAEVARAGQEARMAGSGFLFPIEEIGASTHYASLRLRYTAAARAEVLKSLIAGVPIVFDALRAITFRYPLVWESDLKGWFAEWQHRGLVEIVGKGSKQRVPKPDQMVRWKGPASGEVAREAVLAEYASAGSGTEPGEGGAS